MGIKSYDNSKENIYNFNTEPIKNKAGVWFKKFNFWNIFKAPFKFIFLIYSFIIGESPSPFSILINTLFDVYFQNITQSQSKLLVKTLNEEFSNIYNSIKYDLEDLIKDIIKKDDIEKKTQTEFENNKNKFLKNSEKSKDINILLIGKTGVGKSTLINALLKLNNSEMAKESIGNVGTLEYKIYSSNNWKNINLIDSRGFDFGNPFDEYKKQTINFVKNRNEDIIKFIDIVYYCFKDNRFENEEKQLLLALKEIYKDKNVPFIFVYTQDVMCNFDYMKEYVKKELDDENIIIVDILAKDMKLKNGSIIKAYGIQELKFETKKKFLILKIQHFIKNFIKIV